MDGGQPPRIMIVEDELIVAQNLEIQLAKLGYVIVGIAASGEEAILLAEKTQPELILMDIKIAGSIDGVETAERILNRMDIPIIYLTAFADTKTLQRAKITHPFGYILKPFELRNLHSTIEIAFYKHNMEKKLKDSEIRFRTLAESSPVGIFRTDANGHCLYVNRTLLDITGLTPEEALGTGITKAYHPDDRDNINRTWLELKKAGKEFQLEYRLVSPSGKITWVFGRALALRSESEEIQGYIGTLTDISLVKRLEEEILTVKKLESIGILAGGIAHDFNNLLSVILGTLSILKDDSRLDKEQTMMLENMERATNQASELAQKLITFSRGGWLNSSPLSLTSFLEEYLAADFSGSNPPIHTDFSNNLPMINGDKTQLKQVFKNLVFNAIEAGGKRENEIVISVKLCPVIKELHSLAPASGDYIKVIVSDKGEGIPQENLGKIFDPYFTTRAKSSKKGLGLGLTICYSIVQKHGGFIEVSSQVGVGTDISLYFPVYKGEVSEDGATNSVETKPIKKTKVLVMDDDSVVLDVTSRMLDRLGYEVTTFEEGGSAFNSFKSQLDSGNPYDVILLDIINKKGLDGKETFARIKEILPNAKIIALSGYADSSEIQHLKSFGFGDVLIKPYKVGDLKVVMERFTEDINNPG